MTTTQQHQCGVCEAATTNETDAYGYKVRLCDTCRGHVARSYGELADFTHAKQVLFPPTKKG